MSHVLHFQEKIEKLKQFFVLKRVVYLGKYCAPNGWQPACHGAFEIGFTGVCLCCGYTWTIRIVAVEGYIVFPITLVNT